MLSWLISKRPCVEMFQRISSSAKVASVPDEELLDKTRMDAEKRRAALKAMDNAVDSGALSPRMDEVGVGGAPLLSARGSLPMSLLWASVGRKETVRLSACTLPCLGSPLLLSSPGAVGGARCPAARGSHRGHADGDASRGRAISTGQSRLARPQVQCCSLVVEGERRGRVEYEQSVWGRTDSGYNLPPSVARANFVNLFCAGISYQTLRTIWMSLPLLSWNF